MVYRKGSYSTELEICDRKSELWRKTENLRRSENSKFGFDVQTWTFEGCFNTKMILKNILNKNPQSFRSDFQLK